MKLADLFHFLAVILSFVFLFLAIINFPNKYSFIYAFVSLGFMYNSTMWHNKKTSQFEDKEKIGKVKIKWWDKNSQSEKDTQS